MKYIFNLLIIVFVSFNIYAQTPEKISYQGIIRASDNSLVVNANISIKILIIQGSISGGSVYEEIHTAKTNSNGLVTLEIGTGVVNKGNFTTIPWENGPFYVETQVDINNTSSFDIIGVSQLLSVPFALHAKSAASVVGPDGLDPYKANILNFNASRNISLNDVNNTLACITTSTLTLTVNFSSMKIGDTINLEAHNGALLTIKAQSGVSINYTNAGTAKFVSKLGNVRFGLLRKSGENAYIISGQ